MERRGVEPPTSALRTQKSLVATLNQQQLTATPDSGCTSGCTCNACLLQLAAVLREWLDGEERRRLVELLLGD